MEGQREMVVCIFLLVLVIGGSVEGRWRGERSDAIHTGYSNDTHISSVGNSSLAATYFKENWASPIIPRSNCVVDDSKIWCLGSNAMGNITNLYSFISSAVNGTPQDVVTVPCSSGTTSVALSPDMSYIYVYCEKQLTFINIVNIPAVVVLVADTSKVVSSLSTNLYTSDKPCNRVIISGGDGFSSTGCIPSNLSSTTTFNWINFTSSVYQPQFAAVVEKTPNYNVIWHAMAFNSTYSSINPVQILSMGSVVDVVIDYQDSAYVLIRVNGSTYHITKWSHAANGDYTFSWNVTFEANDPKRLAVDQNMNRLVFCSGEPNTIWSIDTGDERPVVQNYEFTSLYGAQVSPVVIDEHSNYYILFVSGLVVFNDKFEPFYNYSYTSSVPYVALGLGNVILSTNQGLRLLSTAPPPPHYPDYWLRLLIILLMCFTALTLVIVVFVSVSYFLIRRKLIGSDPVSAKKGYALITDPELYIDADTLDIQYNKPLGQGKTTSIYRALYDGNVVAVKIYNDTANTSSLKFLLPVLEREIAVLKGIFNPNILRFYGLAILSIEDTETGTMEKQLSIVTEFCDKGSLQEVLHNPGERFFHWEHILIIAKQICSGMKHLHSRGILHRDLHSGNILLTKDFSVRITDFGFSGKHQRPKYIRRVAANGSNISSKHKPIGRHGWNAPEVYQGRYAQGSEVWSFGIVMWEMMTRRWPYEERKGEDRSVRERVEGGELPEMMSWFPEEVKDMLHRCWGKEEERRSFKELCGDLESMEKTVRSEDLPMPIIPLEAGRVAGATDFNSGSLVGI